MMKGYRPVVGLDHQAQWPTSVQGMIIVGSKAEDAFGDISVLLTKEDDERRP